MATSSANDNLLIWTRSASTLKLCSANHSFLSFPTAWSSTFSGLPHFNWLFCRLSDPPLLHILFNFLVFLRCQDCQCARLNPPSAVADDSYTPNGYSAYDSLASQAWCPHAFLVSARPLVFSTSCCHSSSTRRTHASSNSSTILSWFVRTCLPAASISSSSRVPICFALTCWQAQFALPKAWLPWSRRACLTSCFQERSTWACCSKDNQHSACYGSPQRCFYHCLAFWAASSGRPWNNLLDLWLYYNRQNRIFFVSISW